MMCLRRFCKAEVKAHCYLFDFCFYRGLPTVAVPFDLVQWIIDVLSVLGHHNAASRRISETRRVRQHSDIF